MNSVRAGSIGLLLGILTLTGCGAFTSPQQRIAIARKDIRAGDWRGAAVELHTVLQSHANNAEAWLLLARLSLDAGDVKGAPAALQHAMAAGAKGPAVDALRVRTWLATGQPNAVLDALAHHGVRLDERAQSLALARAYLALRQPDKALQTLQPLLARQPALTEATVLSAESLAGVGRFDDALQQLDAATQRDPRSPDAPLLRGRLLAARGQFAEAERSLVLALRRMPPAQPLSDRVVALATLTEVRLAQTEVDAAASSQGMLAQLAPNSPLTQLLDARIKLARGDTQGGTDELERVVANAPNFVPARMLLGATQLTRGNLQQAEEELEQVVQQTPDNIDARKLLTTVRLKLGQPEAALAQPEDQTRTLNLAQTYLSAGRPRDALALLEQPHPGGNDDANPRRDGLLIAALMAVSGPGAAGEQVEKLVAAHPRDPAVLDLGASYYLSQNDLDRSRALLQEALEVEPGNVGTVIPLARLDAITGDLSGARSTLSAALSANPGALPVRLALADVLVRMKLAGQALSLLESADGAQATPGLELGIARVELAQGDLKRANVALDRAIAMQPRNAAVVEDAGAVLLEAKQYDAALARFMGATQLAPDNPGYWLDAARAQLAMNQPSTARVSLERAARMRPQWLPVVSALALLDLRAKNGQAALARAEALIAAHPDDPGALALKGDVEAALNDPTAALQAYEKAQHQRATAAVALSLFHMRLAAHAPQPQKPLEEWLALEPNDWRVHDELGGYELLRGQLPAAGRDFGAVLRQMPNEVVALNDLAWIYGKLGDPRAESLAARAYQLAPDSASVADTLGWIRVGRGEVSGALPVLAHAAQLHSGDPEIEYHYAYALLKAGKQAEARRILTELLSTPQKFDSREEAQRLLAAARTS